MNQKICAKFYVQKIEQDFMKFENNQQKLRKILKMLILA